MPKKNLIIGGIVLAIIAGVGIMLVVKPGPKPPATPQALPTKAPAPVNQIPVSERPYVTLQPLTARNELQIVIYDVKKEASTVEVVLEYDRNKGVLDSVLKQFNVTKIPLTEKLFLGSKSAGGHVTYHDDVIGGKLTLTFEQDKERYALEVPWRYADTARNYREFGTTDGRFQITFDKIWNTSKILAMQSPGLPLPVENELLAGPYVIRGVGPLPATDAQVKIRLIDTADSVSVFGFDGDVWQPITSTLDNKTVSFSSLLYQAYIVTR
jgi:hypothetical protein